MKVRIENEEFLKPHVKSSVLIGQTPVLRRLLTHENFLHRVQIQKKVISYLKGETHFLSKVMWSVCLISRERSVNRT
jgi:hypothetical protein